MYAGGGASLSTGLFSVLEDEDGAYSGGEELAGWVYDGVAIGVIELGQFVMMPGFSGT